MLAYLKLADVHIQAHAPQTKLHTTTLKRYAMLYILVDPNLLHVFLIAIFLA